MLSPKRTKFRKQFKGRINGAAKAGTSLNFGAFGLKAMEPERLNAREIEAARRAITRHRPGSPSSSSSAPSRTSEADVDALRCGRARTILARGPER
jgi:hypothetical protein